MCQMGNEVPGDFCLLLKRVGCGMLGKGKRHWYLSSCVFMLTAHEEKPLAQVREAPRGLCAAEVLPEHYAKCTAMSNFMGCCPCGTVRVSPRCRRTIFM